MKIRAVACEGRRFFIFKVFIAKPDTKPIADQGLATDALIEYGHIPIRAFFIMWYDDNCCVQQLSTSYLARRIDIEIKSTTQFISISRTHQNLVLTNPSSQGDITKEQLRI